ncbi:MAG: hypothetical protein JWO09_1082 [Bacteroidetes bacterium]|nr:hypothetical protein [Bacteroidota bacterium]
MQRYTTLLFFFLLIHLSTNAQDKAGYREKFTEGNYLILEGNYARALKAFQEAYQLDSSTANINFKLGFCYLKTVTEKSKALPYLEKAVLNTTKNYVDMEPREKAAPVNAYYYYGEALHLNYKFDEAIANYEKFKSFLKPKQVEMIRDIDRHIEISNTAKTFVAGPIPVVITNLGDSINSPYPDYSPVLSADESTIIFTSRRPGSTGGDKTDEDQFYEDIYISYRKPDSTWTIPVSISANVNSITHEASVGLTADAQTLLIYKDGNGGDIYFSTLDGNNWTFPQQMGSDINSPNWETSACLTPDGNTLYFVSDRKEGGMGGRDIWKCVKLPNGKWSRAVNLGAPINTPYDEESPFIHPSGNVLFFSSKGHQTIGGFDIFFSTRGENGWDEPLNIGYPINTTDDDVFYVTSPDGKRGYYSSSSRAEGYGEKDIYMISIPERKEQPLVLIKGVIIPAAGTQLPNNLEIVATNNETGIVTGVYKPLMRDGSFTIIIPPNSNYTLSYQQNGEEFYSEVMDVPADAAYQEINREVRLKGVNFGQPVSVDHKDSTQNTRPGNTDKPVTDKPVTNKEISYVSVGGRIFDKDNKPMNNMKVNLMNSEGQIIGTTTSDALGWFLFSELPQNANYIVALEEEDTEIGKKSFVEFRDSKGNVIKTKSLGSGKFQMASSNTTVKFKAKAKSTASPATPVVAHHEALASVDKLNFKMNFKYNVTETDVNDEPFKQFIDNIMELYAKNGKVSLKIESSASTVPTRSYGGSNKQLSIARAEKGKEQILAALKDKGADLSKVTVTSMKSFVGGPQYSVDYLQNKEQYERFQFIKISAY